MKKLALGAMMVGALLLYGVSATEVEARPPCVWKADITATQVATNQTVVFLESGNSLQECQASVSSTLIFINGSSAWSDPSVSTACHPVGPCRQSDEDPVNE